MYDQDRVDVRRPMGPHLVRCDTVPYERNVVTGQSEDGHCLRGVGVRSKLLLANLEDRIGTGVRTGEGGDVSVVQDKGPTSCQLRDTYSYDTYMMVVVDVVVAAELVVRESVLECANQGRFHVREVGVEKLKEKGKEI